MKTKKAPFAENKKKSHNCKNNRLLVGIGSDHAGFYLKEEIKLFLESIDIPYKDIGCYEDNSVDYPDIALNVANSVREGKFSYGILCCGTGIGMAMAANKISGIRAALCHDVTSARLSRRHNDANVLALGGRMIGSAVAMEIVKIWLETPFEGGRHIARLAKIAKIEHGGSRKEEFCQ